MTTERSRSDCLGVQGRFVLKGVSLKDSEMSVIEEKPAVRVPARMQSLPIDPVWKLPVPWFVEWIDGKPAFPVASGKKWGQAVRDKLCWCCGKKLGDVMAFVIGPMCGINRTTSEPPCDVLCAIYAAQACPFLTRPKMKRMDISAYTEAGAVDAPGIPIDRNPGCCAIWITKRYEVFDAGNGPLIELGEPQIVHWYAEGRKATRAEVLHSIETGLPALLEMAKVDGPEAEAELIRRQHQLERWLPK